MELTTVKRVFIVGTTKLDDPAPGQPLKAAVRILSTTYPQFRWTDVLEEDGKLVDGELHFKLVLPPAKTNG